MGKRKPWADDVFYWTKMDHLDGTFYLVSSERGLCCITWPHEPFDTIRRFQQNHASHGALVEDHHRLQAAVHQLEEYWNGQRRDFDIPLHLMGTPFQLSVWKTLQTIPYGTISTYGAIAAQIGKPRATRAVGSAISQNPVPIVIPCHRIIGKDKSLTGFGGGLRLKSAMLRLEGYDAFVESGHSRYAY